MNHVWIVIGIAILFVIPFILIPRIVDWFFDGKKRQGHKKRESRSLAIVIDNPLGTVPAEIVMQSIAETLRQNCSIYYKTKEEAYKGLEDGTYIIAIVRDETPFDHSTFDTEYTYLTENDSLQDSFETISVKVIGSRDLPVRVWKKIEEDLKLRQRSEKV